MATIAKRIVVLWHPDDPYDRTPYIIHVLIDEWRRRGIPADVTVRLDRPVDDKVLIIPHLDITVMPPACDEFLRRCPLVLNRTVSDISKRRISRNLVTSPDAHAGPVIVKSNRNAGGWPERNRAHRQGGMKRAIVRAGRRLPWTLSGVLGPNDYKVYDHSRLVPRAVWRNRRLVVEKFLPERQGELYCLRQHVFLGSREFNTLSLSPEPLVKARKVICREFLSEAPPALREFRRQLGFDYGKFDYVVHEGEVVLFDANRTPAYNARATTTPLSMIQGLAAGIDEFLGVTAPAAART